MRKCAVDVAYFSNTFCKIEHPKRGKINFNLFPFQSLTLEQFQKNQFNIVLKSRQMGISTLCSMYALHQMLFQETFKVLVIATKQEVARNIVKMVQVMYDNLPSWMTRNAKVINKNKLELVLSNGSQIKAVSSKPDSARSSAISLLILDEFAFMESAEEIWGSAQMTLATGGNAIILSTPNGAGGMFYKLWQQAESGINSDGMGILNPIKMDWKLHPERDQKWRDQQTELLGERIAAQENDCSFLSSGHTVLESSILNYYRDKKIEPLERRGIGGEYWLWKYPDFSKSYCVIADVARGDGEDYSAFIVFDVETAEQVAEFKGKIDTNLFGSMLVSVGIEWNDALLVIDNKNIGWSTVQVAIDKNYPNLYYSYKHDPYIDDNIQLVKRYDLANKEDMVPGFTGGTLIRPVMISKLESYTREKIPIFYSKRLINELEVFKWINGKAQAEYGYNDDLVMCVCMFLYVRDTALRLRQMGIDLIKHSLANTHKSVYKPTQKTHASWEIGVGDKKENLKWLL